MHEKIFITTLAMKILFCPLNKPTFILHFHPFALIGYAHMCVLFAYMCEWFSLHFCGLTLNFESHARENLHNDSSYENALLPIE